MATNTYVALDKKTITSNVTSVEFTAIPAGYTDLVIIGTSGSTASEDYLQFVFNSDTAANYCAQTLSGNGTNASAGRQTSRNALWVDWNVSSDNSVSKNINVSIMNYSNATTYKSVVIRGNRATSTTPLYRGTELQMGSWRKTPEAITSILIKYNPGNSILAGSTFSLYGIKAEGAGYATGGYITSDANYYYHTFTSTGVFTPLQSLSCETLVIAGGGGAISMGGGGGAGGVVTNTLSLSATNYAVTVGGGGTGSDYGVQNTAGTNTTFSTLTANGGGPARGPNPNSTNGNGGSGGGGGFGNPTPGGTATTGSGGTAYGNNGGTGNDTVRATGGGGGAGAVGANSASTVSGNGGAGTSLFTAWGLATGTGQNVGGTYFYAGGGGGGGDSNSGYTTAAGTGGNGGGGNGSITTTGTNASGWGGGGGGGGRFFGTTYSGGNGASGLVIVRYLKA